MNRAMLLLGAALTSACGGASFGLLDAGDGEAPRGIGVHIGLDAVDGNVAADGSDGARDVAEVDVAEADAAVDTSEAAPVEAAATEAATVDAKHDADAGRIDAADAAVDVSSIDAAQCTPVPAMTVACGMNAAPVSAPTEFCWVTGFGTSPTGAADPTPPECQCKETYTCACLLAATRASCGGGAPARCSEATAVLIIYCP